MANERQTNVHISLYASGLKNTAGLGKGVADPYAVVTLLAGSADERPRIIGRTEIIKNSLNPSWTTTFKADYSFGQESRINIGIFDEIRKKKSNKSMGSAQFEIGEILGAKGNVKAKKLKNGGTLFVRVTKGPKLDLGNLTLGLRGIKMKNVDGMFSKSDPFFVVESYTKGNHGGRVWQPVYRSEVVKNNLNPTWQECEIPLQKICGGDKEQPIQISVYDWEKNGKHHPMGKCQTSANGLLTAGTMNTAFELIQKGKSYGKVMIAKATISGQELDANKPPPKFATVRGIRQLNPDYKRWQANFGEQQQSSSVAQRNPSRPQAHSGTSPPRVPDGRPALQNRTTQHPSVPAMHYPSTMSFNAHSALPPAMPPPVAPTSSLPSGASMPPSFGSDNRPKFVDYISGGTEINLAVAIDFTGSNGDPRKPGTLHYIHRDGQLNDYEKALTAVGSVVARYDTDQLFPVYGFGAKFGGVIHHCFQVGKAAELQGVAGMIEGYRGVFQSGLTMSGPTVFAEVIQQTAVQAQSRQEANRKTGKQCYSILLILTDGAVTDIEQTKEAIRFAGTAPLSIVIVGVGDADFSKMQFLDDFHQEDASVRDIVQFVEFNQHTHNKQALTSETLDEIPSQLVDYFYSNGINPLPPVSGSTMLIYAADYNSYEDVDLDIGEGPGGEMTLLSSTQARWDATSYGNAPGYLSPPIQPPSSVSGGAYRQPSMQPATSPPPTFGGQGYSMQPSMPVPSGLGVQGYRQSSLQPPPSAGLGVQGYRQSSLQPPPSAGLGVQGYRQSSLQPPPSAGLGVQGYRQPSMQPSHSGTGQYSATPQVLPGASVPVTLRVKAPPNSYPGMQIRVKHPHTGQFHVVAIPSGVHAGTEFRVNL